MVGNFFDQVPDKNGIEFYYTSFERTALTLQNVQNLMKNISGQSSFFFLSTRHLVDRTATN